MFDFSLMDITDISVDSDLGEAFHTASGDQGLEMMGVDHISTSSFDINRHIMDIDGGTFANGGTFASGDSLHGIEPDAFHREFVESHDTENPLRQSPVPPDAPPPSVDINWGDIVLLASVLIGVGLLFVYFEDK